MKFIINKGLTKLILKESTREEYNQLKRILNPYVKNYRFMQRYKLGVWDGKIDNFKDGRINLGLWKTVYDVCQEYGYPFIVENKEFFPRDDSITYAKIEEFCKEFFNGYTVNGKTFFPYDHQIKAVQKLMKYKFGLVEIATAGGKSLAFFIMMGYILKYINPKAKFLLIVPSISLVTQFYDDILDYNEGYNKEQKNPFDLKLLEIMSDRPRKVRDGQEPNIYIGTYQSLEKYDRKFFKQFHTVAVDECLHPDTLIKMSDNTEKKIKDIRVGDFVWSFNEKTKNKEVKEVEYVYKNLSKDQQMFEIEMENGEKIKITGNHKVLLTSGDWKRVDKLTEKNDILDFNI